MKTLYRHMSRGSTTLATIFVVAAVLMAGLGGLLKWSGSAYHSSVNRSKKAQLLYAADAGIQYAHATLEQYVSAFDAHPTMGDFNTITDHFAGLAVSDFPDDVELVKFKVTPGTGYHTNGLADTWFPGLRASVVRFGVEVGVQDRNDPDRYLEVQETIETRAFSLFEYSIFFDFDLEIHPGPAMNIQGPVHANGDILMNCDGALKFDSFITSASNIIHLTALRGESRNNGPIYIKDAEDLYQSMLVFGSWLDSNHPFWLQGALLRWDGRVLSTDHGVERLSILPAEIADKPRILIEPPPGTNESAGVHEARYANRSMIRVMPDGSVEKYNSDTENYQQIATVNTVPWALTTNKFWNGRQAFWVDPLDIDVQNFEMWAQANVPEFFSDAERGGILYVARPEHSGQAVRLYNGSSVPCAVVGGITNGFTVATPNPLYIRGNYNDTTKAPASVLSDAFTLQSSAWQDDESLCYDPEDPKHNVNPPNANDTSVFTSMISGITHASNDAHRAYYQGGVENFPRFLEDWAGKKCDVIGSIVCLWYSEYETAYWNPDDPTPGALPGYYQPPIRWWGWDPNFGTAPAGAPRFHEFVPYDWKVVYTQ